MPETAAEANLRKQLEQTLAAEPSSLLHHYSLGVFQWDHAEAEEAAKQEGEEEARRFRAAAAEHFLAAAKLNPNDGVPFRFLGHHYTRAGDAQRAAKCHQRSVALNPDDAEAGEALCDLLDVEGKRSWSLLCARRQLASDHVRFGPSRCSATYRFIKGNGQKLYKAFSTQCEVNPTCADLWEALGLAYLRLGMFTAAVNVCCFRF